MKKPLLLLMVCLIFVPAWAADSIKFNEVLRDVNECYREEGETFCDVFTQNAGRASARVTIPGLHSVPFTGGTSLGFSLGSLELAGSLSEAASFGPNRAVFYLQEEIDDGYDIRFRRVGTVTLSRSGDTLTINASFKRLPSSIVAESGNWNEDGFGVIGFNLHVEGEGDSGSLEYGRDVYFLARTSSRFAGENELRTIKVKGVADFTPPKVKVLALKNKAVTTSDTILFQGTASDNIGVLEVQYRVGDDDWSSAQGAEEWSAEVFLNPGQNTVQVRSIDIEGQASKIVTRLVTYNPPPVPSP